MSDYGRNFDNYLFFFIIGEKQMFHMIIFLNKSFKDLNFCMLWKTVRKGKQEFVGLGSISYG